MILRQLALVSRTPAVPFSEVALISAAVQKQVTRDFAPIWRVQATVDAFNSINDVPLGYWPIVIVEDVEEGLGIHLSDNGQPFALVEASNQTSLTCSHEALEMLADPFGMRMVASQSIKPDQRRVSYLVEVCDPCESPDLAYTVNGVAVSNFYTPNFFDPVQSPGVRYSFNAGIGGPRQVLPGGYLSWMEPQTGEWWQAINRGAGMEFRNLGVLRRGAASWREIIDAATPFPLEGRPRTLTGDAAARKPGSRYVAGAAAGASAGWAAMLEREIARVTGMAA